MIAAEVIRKFATDVDAPVLAEPRKGFFVRFKEEHSGRRDAVKHSVRSQNTLHHHRTTLGSNLICDATNLRGGRRIILRHVRFGS